MKTGTLTIRLDPAPATSTVPATVSPFGARAQSTETSTRASSRATPSAASVLRPTPPRVRLSLIQSSFARATHPAGARPVSKMSM